MADVRLAHSRRSGAGDMSGERARAQAAADDARVLLLCVCCVTARMMMSLRACRRRMSGKLRVGLSGSRVSGATPIERQQRKKDRRQHRVQQVCATLMHVCAGEDKDVAAWLQ